MSFVIIDAERYALQIGENTLGGGGDDAVSAPSLAAAEPFAVVTVLAGEPTTVRTVRGASRVTLDGELLGDVECELRHGARIEGAGCRVVFGDIRTVGTTAHVTGVTEDEFALLSAALPGEPTADTGGRLVAVRGGVAYPVPDEGLVIGREPSCTIALRLKAVSRRHASIQASLQGYVLTDTSANGVLVNGVRVAGQQLLGQGDVIRVADAEFRFEADPGSLEPAPELRGGSAHDDASQPSAIARAKAETAPRLLATLEVVNAGALSGTRFRIERTAVQIGRGAQSDIRLTDESVSGSHATLLQRAGRWHVLDLGSTNGSYVDGERVDGEHALSGPAELRFGNIKMVFRPIAPAPTPPPVTRAIVGVAGDATGRGGARR